MDDLLAAERPALHRRVRRMVGDPDLAEDLVQETFLRAWRALPRHADGDHQAAWLHRTAANLGVDALRRRGRTPSAELDEAMTLAALPADPAEAEGVAEALAQLTPHERLVLLLRFEGGLSLREIGALLDLSEEAARKRVARARRRFAEAWRAVRTGPPLVLLVVSEDPPGPYRRWLERTGVRVRLLRRDAIEREVATADALVFSGSRADVHPGAYGEETRGSVVDPDPRRDASDLAALRCALRHDVPLVGICRGGQLLNVVRGGTLYQDLASERAGGLPHAASTHAIDTAAGTLTRRVFGTRTTVRSEHHQAARRLGRGVMVSATGSDGVVEGVELDGARFALGLQWHPEHPDSGQAGERVARALVDAVTA